MVPSRVVTPVGMNYEPKDYDQIKAEQDAVKDLMNSPVKVEMWQMISKKYTQAMVTYRGKESIVCISDRSPTNDPQEIENIITQFYQIVDLEKTAILRRASTNDKQNSAPIKKETYHSSTGLQNKRASRKCKAELNLTQIDMEANNAVYKEKLIDMYVYFNERLDDASIPLDERDTFTTQEVVDGVFSKEQYPDVSEITRKNKEASHMRYLLKNGYVKRVGQRKWNVPIYKVISNPYENEMPEEVKAEFDSDQAKESMHRDLEAMRRTNDGFKC